MILKITVKLLVGLHKYSPTGEPQFILDVSKGEKVQSVLTRLGLPQQGRKVVLVNGHQALADQELQANDLLVVFPPMEGG